MATAMQVTVEGEDIGPAEISESAGWITAFSRRKSTSSRQTLQPCNVPRGANKGAAPASVRKRLTAASRLPRLPTEHFRVIVRPRGGLDIKKTGHFKIAQALIAAAGLTSGEVEDVICPNMIQNIMVASTPSERNAKAYNTVASLIIDNVTYEVNAYMAAPNNTSKGVIRDIDPTLDQDELTRLIVQPGTLLLGHRADVCPSPEDGICRGCGTSNPDDQHNSPKCALCGGNHLTASRDCKRRFQVPYVVRQRRRARRYQKSQEAHDSTGAEPLPPKSATSRRSRSSETRGNRYRVLAEDNSPSPGRASSKDKGRSVSRGRKGYKPDSLKGQTKKVTGGTPPEHSNTRVAQLEKENALLKREMQQLRAEIAELRNATKHNPVQPPAPLQYVEDEAPMEVPVEEASSERPAKKRAIVDSACSSSAMKAKSEIKDAIESLSITVGAIKATLDGLVEGFSSLSLRHDELEKHVFSMSQTPDPTKGKKTSSASAEQTAAASRGIFYDQLAFNHNHGSKPQAD
ncbi:hypothetical protein HPB52_007707 [Rhipicephalus sanguineus]|uniref:Uncharacterized protein n=1 Tax=Rhipicephalus sanguineus TaxID=34632 RepID=A0A9D4Q5I1_RHISA|nr:hypothetical protein HPB52_007707 [Rhipicephalus sanguineus]